jgi:DNA topoisomerase VI subunit B
VYRFANRIPLLFEAANDVVSISFALGALNAPYLRR